MKHDLSDCGHTDLDHVLLSLADEMMMAAAIMGRAVASKDGPAEAGVQASFAIWMNGFEEAIRLAVVDRKAAKRILQYLQAKYLQDDPIRYSETEKVYHHDVDRIIQAVEAL